VTERPLLSSIRSGTDVRKLSAEQLPELAAEIRAELLDVVSTHGGHLASNLGVVELTIALVHSFDLDTDSVVWDTGHQGYVYKLLTGRRELFRRLREHAGCCGFLHRAESPYDTFGAGHAGTAISAALGFAAARDRSGGDGRVVAVVGDGAMGTGVALEGLNSIIETTGDFILVINDNRMSISPNVGALSRYLNSIISGEPYNRFKRVLRNLVCRIPKIGVRLRRLIQRLEEATKSVLVPGVLFEELGLRYIGPLDGHDLPQLVETFESARRLKQPLVLHVLTEKGHGYPHAEQAPEMFHSLSAFDVESGQPMSGSGSGDCGGTFSSALGDILLGLLQQREDVVAITAGMCRGTGLKSIREAFPARLFDVGIAEEHAVVFAAGLAAAGLRPVVALYATFMQRAVDYVFHDVCLQNLPVVFCLDRAGVVADGPTHHGIHDLAFWRSLPNLSVLQPADRWEFEAMLRLLLERSAPGVLRYPKGDSSELTTTERSPIEWGKAEVLRRGTDVAIWALGRESARAEAVAEQLADNGIDATVVNARFFMPFDRELLLEHARVMPVVTLEDHCVEGGFGSLVNEVLAPIDGPRILCRGWPRDVIPWGTESEIRAQFGLDVDTLVSDVRQFLGTPVPV